MKEKFFNTSGSNPNYLNTSTTQREVEFNEITPAEGSLSEMLKNFKVIFEDEMFIVDDFIVYDETSNPTEDGNDQ